MNKDPNGRTGAVVVGLGLNGLGVVRSLGAAGICPTVLTNDLNAPETKTRFGHIRSLQGLSGKSLCDKLIALAKELGERPVLFLTQEQSVLEVSKRAEELQEYYRFTMPSCDIIEKLQHKGHIMEAAIAAGVPYPPGMRLTSADQVPGLRDLTYPCAFKPAVRNADYDKRFAKAYRLSSADEAADLFEQASPWFSDFVVQEWVEGADSDIFFCLLFICRNGEVLTSFSGRKVRSWPLQTGGTASCMGAPEHHDEMLALSVKFLSEVGFTGLVGVEFKRCSNTGQFMLIEPTVARTDYQAELATLTGVNQIYQVYLHECGLPVPTARPHDRPVAWRDPVADANAIHAAGLRGRPFPLGTKVFDGFFRGNDPGPWIALRSQQICNRMNRILRPINARQTGIQPS